MLLLAGHSKEQRQCQSQAKVTQDAVDKADEHPARHSEKQSPLRAEATDAAEPFIFLHRLSEDISKCSSQRPQYEPVL